ncbi:XRE family transcriptional regulator [Gordonia sp. LSe1-13]|uniref:XRE family transcriptional regulator n=1 Tax=Gordonia sesuvii TaxID=3116777 RepID=A0ABU7M8J7_9ACTN|nr:XRE family transcriptional regulator [Gordonia sp. LSe1-13]
MDDGASALASAIGARVRKERLARQWTLDRLAESAAVSRRMLINVEQGSANPSVGTLLKISDALGLGLPALIAPPEPKEVTVTRSGEGATLWRGDRGGRGVLVAGTLPPNVVELWDWTLSPGDRHDIEAHTAGTMELILVREGVVEVRIGERTVTLGVGDAVTFAGDESHSYSNSASTSARFALTVFEPGVGAQARRKVNDA